MSPCCSLETCNGDTKVAQTDPLKAEQDNDCNGVCSPFFACGGCHVSSVAFNFDVMQPLFLQLLKAELFVAKCSFIPSYFANIWQPPKIG